MDTTVEVKYHTGLQFLPLNKFIDVFVDGNLSALVISGFPSADNLKQAWETILDQYSDMIGGMEHEMFFQLRKEVGLLKMDIDLIRILAARGSDTEDKGILRMVYIKTMADDLNELLGTTCSFNWNDQKTYNDELDKCVNRGKALLIRYDMKNLQFLAMQKEDEKGKGEKKVVMDRAYFTSILIILSDHVKYRLEETILMQEYGIRLKTYSQYCELLKKPPK